MNVWRRAILVAGILVALVGIGVLLVPRWSYREQPSPAHDPFLRVKELQHKPEGKGYTSREFEELLQLASNPDVLVRVRALTALFRAQPGEQKQRALEVMHRALRDPSAVVRAYAVSGIERLGSKEDVPALLPLRNDPEPRVRQRVERALQRLGYRAQSGGAP